MTNLHRQLSTLNIPLCGPFSHPLQFVGPICGPNNLYFFSFTPLNVSWRWRRACCRAWMCQASNQHLYSLSWRWTNPPLLLRGNNISLHQGAPLLWGSFTYFYLFKLHFNFVLIFYSSQPVLWLFLNGILFRLAFEKGRNRFNGVEGPSGWFRKVPEGERGGGGQGKLRRTGAPGRHRNQQLEDSSLADGLSDQPRQVLLYELPLLLWTGAVAHPWFLLVHPLCGTRPELRSGHHYNSS